MRPGTEYSIETSTDLRTWSAASNGKAAVGLLEYSDSEAFKFNHRFYRLVAQGAHSANVLGYASITLPPGFSMIANPFNSAVTIGETFKNWPDGTALNRFDTTLFRLVENGVKSGHWADPDEKLMPGEGAIFFNPTSDYKTVTFLGEVGQGHLSIPIPAGFSVRSSPVPLPGHLVDELGFPIGTGDVIHLFDRERQRYLIYPYGDGEWTAGAPVLSLGESFWVAKTRPGTWTRKLEIEETDAR